MNADIYDYPFIKTWHLASIALYVCTQIETISFMQGYLIFIAERTQSKRNVRYLVLPPSPIDMNNLGAYLVSGNWINLQCIVAEETYDLLQRKNRVKRVLFRASDDQQWTRSRWWSLMHYFQHKSFDTFKFDNSCHMLNEIKMYVHRAWISVRTHFIVSPVRSIQIVGKWLRFAFALEK